MLALGMKSRSQAALSLSLAEEDLRAAWSLDND